MPRCCIWVCGRKANSDEDALAEWVRDWLGFKAGQKRWLLRDHTPPGKTTLANPPPGTKRFHRARAAKIVCDTCNSGWMSVLQNQAKHLLMPMFQAETCQLPPLAQATVANWATMTGICLQYVGRVSVVRSQREYFYQHRSPPPNTNIFLAHLPGAEEPWTLHTSHAISIAERRAVLYAELFAIGALGFLVFRGPLHPTQRSILSDAGAYLLQVWGPTIATIEWPLPKPLATSEFRLLFERLMPATA